MSGPGPVRMLARGLTRRCPRCGSGHLFGRWFTMVRHCPRCGMRFERDEGFFLGAYVINYAAAALVVALVLGAIIVLEAGNANVNLVPVIGLGALATLVTPIAFYPFSKTLWTAIELIMRPLDIGEVAEATIAHAADAAPATGGERSADP